MYSKLCPGQVGIPGTVPFLSSGCLCPHFGCARILDSGTAKMTYYFWVLNREDSFTVCFTICLCVSPGTETGTVQGTENET